MIERIAFGYASPRDFQPVATSLPPSRLEEPANWLRRHVRLGHPQRPPMSLVYLRRDDCGAVLCRLSYGATGDGRDDVCRCLLGSPAELTAKVALTLHDWDGWHRRHWVGTELAPIAVPIRNYAVGSLRDACVQRKDELVSLMAAALRNPAAPLSIIADESTCLPDRAGLLLGMEAVLGPLFEGAGRPPFTFSTFATFSNFEDRDDRGAPEVAFVPPGPLSSPPFLGRPSVDLRPLPDPLQPDDHYLAAAELVELYLVAGSRPLAEFLRANGVLAPDSIDDRVASLIDLDLSNLAGS